MYVRSFSTRDSTQFQSKSPRYSGNLSETGDSGLYYRPSGVALNLLLKLITVFQMMRSRTNHAHGARQHVYELRYLIQLCISQQTSDRKNSWHRIIGNFRHSLPGDIHRSKFQNCKFFAKPSATALPEKDGPGRLPPLPEADKHCERWQNQDDNWERQTDVETSLHKSSDWTVLKRTSHENSCFRCSVSFLINDTQIWLCFSARQLPTPRSGIRLTS